MTSLEKNSVSMESVRAKRVCRSTSQSPCENSLQSFFEAPQHLLQSWKHLNLRAADLTTFSCIPAQADRTYSQLLPSID